MYKIFLPFLILSSITVTYADSAVQTDWSGGDGILGPVLDWGDEFYQSLYIDWSNYPGFLLLSQGILEYTIDGSFNTALSVYSDDIDGDGDMDVLGAAFYADDITWWENNDGSGTSWSEHIVDGDYDGAFSVYSEDIDGDGDMDILSAAYYANDITWWENVNGFGTEWTEHTVDGNFDGAFSVHSEDIDGDGDMDVLGAAYDADDITWWENVNGSGTEWTEHTIDGDFDAAYDVHSEDIDGDGDMDVLGAAYDADDITWWENIDGLGTSWTEHTVDGDLDGARSVYSEDIDGDGDMDILGAAYYADDIAWWENIDGSGTSWSEHTVDAYFNGAKSVYSEDIDGDGDMDILGAASLADDITWWENIDGLGTSWTKHTVDGSFEGAWSVYSEDIDGDDDMDILGAASVANDITWWDLAGSSLGGYLDSSILDAQVEADWDYLDWNSQTPAGTSASIQVRASDDHTVMGSWSEILTSPCSLEGILNDGDRYVQYRTILETSIPDTTPTLNDVTITWNPFGIQGESGPESFELLPFYPNPSCSAPLVRFGLPEASSVELFIFDVSGRLVEQFSTEEYAPGYHSIILGDLSPGIYFCRMISEDFRETQRLVVVE